MAETIGGEQLERAGFTVMKEVKKKWERPGKWFEVVAPDGEECLMLRVGPHKWHAFGRDRWTGSGSTPERALSGLLGDVIDSDSQLRSYCRTLLSAPERLGREYDGLYEAQSSCYSEFHQI